jgi:hypothetical protein
VTYEEALQLAATAWCGEKTSGKVMDPELAEEFAKILMRVANDGLTFRFKTIDDGNGHRYPIVHVGVASADKVYCKYIDDMDKDELNSARFNLTQFLDLPIKTWRLIEE